MKAGRTKHDEILTKELIPIDMAKTYKLSGWFKSNGKTESKIYFGYVPYDAEKREIQKIHIACFRGTETVLTADCSAEDTVVKIANGAAWRPNVPGGVIAFDVDDSGKLADLPNRNISSAGMIKVVNMGDHWEIHLKNKCGQAYPAGTKVRQQAHYGASFILNAAHGEVVPMEQWTQCAGVIKGCSKNTMENDQWVPGTAYARITLAEYQQDKEVQVLVDDIVMTEVVTKAKTEF